MDRLKENRGYTLLEVLIATFITAVVAAAGFEFYVKMHNQTLTQQEISDMQQTSRAALHEIAGTLRKAGFKLSGHPAYQISGDSLSVFFSETQAVDTVIYYLQQFNAEGVNNPQLPDGFQPRILMKKVNSEYPVYFANLVRTLIYNAVDSATVEISLEVQPSKPDEDYAYNEGVRTFTVTETVHLRNLSL